MFEYLNIVPFRIGVFPKYKNIQFCAIRNVENLNKQNNLLVKKEITKYVKLMYENIRYKY